MDCDAVVIPILALQTNKSNQLLISNSDPSFYITVNAYDIYNNIIYYICEIGIAYNKSDVLIKRVKLRYSKLNDFYRYLLTEYGRVHNFKPFPPKKILWNGTKECAEERMPILNAFLSDLTTVYNLITDYNFKKIFNLDEN